MLTMGIDIGTTSISMVMLDADTGELVDKRTTDSNAFIEGDIPGNRIQDPDIIMGIVMKNMEELIAKNGDPVCIGTTGQMHGMLYTDRSGNAVSPLYTWQDGSGDLPLEGDKSSADILTEKVGAASTGYGLSTHYYLQKKGLIPSDAYKMITICDYMAMKLCGNTEPVISSDMAASWGSFDAENLEFKLEALKAAGMDISYLPKLEKDHVVVGYYKGTIPVISSNGDNQASVLGSVAHPEDTVIINVGTGSQVSMAVNKYFQLSGALEIRPLTSDMYITAGSGLCGGRSYSLLKEFYCSLLKDCNVAGREDAEAMMYAIMEEQCRTFLSERSADEAWDVRTTFSGTRDNPSAKGGIENIGTDNFDPRALTVGVIRGVIKELYDEYTRMCEITGKKSSRLVASGNGIRRNPIMRKIASDMFGMELSIPAYQEEAACGCALNALVACGRARSLDQVRKLIKYE